MAVKRAKRPVEDPDEDEEEEVEAAPLRMRAAVGTPSGTMHVPYRDGVREVHVTNGVTELIPADLEPALEAYGYKRA
jgi:hypothetical protein